jgi:hypothetical protein|tara:strand:- start:1902 stop:2603 length:702 start_codon:yes stop_codon:yes gene_type:complete
MSLPKINIPIFEMELPSTKKKIKYRPFTVKEEKILLVAQEADDPMQEIMAAKQVVSNCIIDEDISKFAMFDLEYVLLVLRSRSVDNTITFQIKDPDTEETVELMIDAENVKFMEYENHTNKIELDGTYTLFLKYPTIEEFSTIVKMDEGDPLVNYFIMISCLNYIASEDEVHHFKDYENDDIDAFMDNLEGSVIQKIQNFFETMPKLRHEMKYKNKEGDDKTFVIEGMRSFFI